MNGFKHKTMQRFSATMGALRSALVAGGLALAPLGITIWVFVQLIELADGVVGLLPVQYQPQELLGFEIPGLGIVITLIVVAAFGVMLRNYLGRRVVEFYEAILARVPILSGVYQGLKELFATLFSSRGQHFRQVVLVEYPRKGLYCLAFMTNDTEYLRLTDEEPESNLVSIFLPTTPNPTSGFYLLVPRSDIRLVDLGVEQAFKLIMSAGIVTPSGLRYAPLMTSVEGKQALQGSQIEDVENENGL